MRIFLACPLLVFIFGCAEPLSWAAVAGSTEFKTIKQSWVSCTFDQAERYHSADPDPQNIAGAVESVCSTHTENMALLFSQHGVDEEQFKSLIADLKQDSRRRVVRYVLEQRANKLRAN